MPSSSTSRGFDLMGMQDRQLITPATTLLRNGDLRASRVPRVRMQGKLPIEIAAR